MPEATYYGNLFWLGTVRQIAECLSIPFGILSSNVNELPPTAARFKEIPPKAGRFEEFPPKAARFRIASEALMVRAEVEKVMSSEALMVLVGSPDSKPPPPSG